MIEAHAWIFFYQLILKWTSCLSILKLCTNKIVRGLFNLENLVFCCVVFARFINCGLHIGCDFLILLLFIKGVQFKRVEALTRSKTVIDLKQNPPTLAEQAEKFPITQSANIKGR